MLVRSDLPVQRDVRPRRRLRLLPCDARLRHRRGYDRRHRRRRPQGPHDHRHAEGDDRRELARRHVHRRERLRRAGGKARAGVHGPARRPDGGDRPADRRGGRHRARGNPRPARRTESQRPRRRRDRLRDRGHRPVRGRDRRADSLPGDVPSRRLEPDDRGSEPLEDRRVRDRLRGQDRVVVGRVRLGGVSVAPAFSAARTRLGLVGVGWWSTAGQMRGMDNGPWSALGAFGWFLGVWVVMMAAMMFPSVAPTAALYARMTRARSAVSPLLFVGGYLVTWAAAGAAAFAAAVIGEHAAGDVLAWDRGGRWAAGATLLVAAAYELTPLKDVCLGKCRSPLGFLLGSWRSGRTGALRMGL